MQSLHVTFEAKKADCYLVKGGEMEAVERLATPSPVQYKWHEQERIMFIHLTPGTWNGSEGDSPPVDPALMHPEKLDTDQWCKAALSWGAKEVLFVAKHVGGFCWWQTDSPYSIKNTPYKNGQGDVLKELSASCKKYGLNLGVYVYPGDLSWGAGQGSGGRTDDPNKQEAYNEVFRKQLTEVLTRYGDMLEVWFDGSCIINVSDILAKHAQNAVIFQGPHATIRWPGTESGKLAYPAWSSVRGEDLRTGVSTQLHSDPDGDCWAPLEADTTLYDHYWLWSSEKAKTRKSVEQLMECYYKSAGYGGVFLLNASPDTSGLIPEEDMKRYKEFGDEIRRRFSRPLLTVADRKGAKTLVKFEVPTKINHVVTMEDYRKGERIREYTIRGLIEDGRWVVLVKGQSVGRKKIDYFQDVSVTAVEFDVTRSVGTPLIRSLSVYCVSDFTPYEKRPLGIWAAPVEVMQFTKDMFQNGRAKIKLDLSGRILLPGQYAITVVPSVDDHQIQLADVQVYYDGRKALQEFATVSGLRINVNRTAYIYQKKDSSVLTFMIASPSPCEGRIIFSPRIVY